MAFAGSTQQTGLTQRAAEAQATDAVSTAGVLGDPFAALNASASLHEANRAVKGHMIQQAAWQNKVEGWMKLNDERMNSIVELLQQKQK